MGVEARAPEPRALCGVGFRDTSLSTRGVGCGVAIEIVQGHATELIRCREAECTRSCPPFRPEVSARDGHALVSPRCHSGAPPTRLRLPCAGGGTSACNGGSGVPLSVGPLYGVTQSDAARMKRMCHPGILHSPDIAAKYVLRTHCQCSPCGLLIPLIPPLRSAKSARRASREGSCTAAHHLKAH